MKIQKKMKSNIYYPNIPKKIILIIQMKLTFKINKHKLKLNQIIIKIIFMTKKKISKNGD